MTVTNSQYSSENTCHYRLDYSCAHVRDKPNLQHALGLKKSKLVSQTSTRHRHTTPLTSSHQVVASRRTELLLKGTKFFRFIVHYGFFITRNIKAFSGSSTVSSSMLLIFLVVLLLICLNRGFDNALHCNSSYPSIPASCMDDQMKSLKLPLFD